MIDPSTIISKMGTGPSVTSRMITWRKYSKSADVLKGFSRVAANDESLGMMFSTEFDFND
jgi:hypothetical protein